MRVLVLFFLNWFWDIIRAFFICLRVNYGHLEDFPSKVVFVELLLPRYLLEVSRAD